MVSESTCPTSRDVGMTGGGLLKLLLLFRVEGLEAAKSGNKNTTNTAKGTKTKKKKTQPQLTILTSAAALSCQAWNNTSGGKKTNCSPCLLRLHRLHRLPFCLEALWGPPHPL